MSGARTPHPWVGKTVIITNKIPKSFDGYRWTYEVFTYPVRVMAVAEGYAMVRRKGAYPSVVSLKELHEPSKVTNEDASPLPDR